MKFIIRISLTVTLVMVTTLAQAQRRVVINGQFMSPQELVVLDQIACSYIPNGNYWLNMQTGAWGYAGNPQLQGYLGQNCQSYNSAPNYNVPGYNGYNYRGPFGDYMSDGNCSFVNGIPVGNCD